MIQKGGFDTTYLFTSLTDVVQDNKVIFLVQYYVKMLWRNGAVDLNLLQKVPAK